MQTEAPVPAGVSPLVEDRDGSEREEKVVVGVAVALALVVGIGLALNSRGLLDGFVGGGGRDVVKVAAPVVDFVHKQAGGDPAKILISGFVVSDAEGKSTETSLRRAFPQSEIKNAVRLDQPKAGVKKAPKKTGTVRVSFAADAVNEQWARPRFGDVKRLEMVWKEEKLTVRGALFSPEARAQLEQAFANVKKEHQGAVQVREVQRPAVAAAELQQQVTTAIGGRAVAFDANGNVNAADAASGAVVSAVAPLLKDLRGLDVWISAGADDRAVALKQAEAAKAALVAAGADANGLRAVPAAKNNAFSLVVREKE